MTIPKYTDQLPIPVDLQPTPVACAQDPGGCDDYTITMTQTTQQMLPANIPTPYPTTNIFAYSATPVGGGTYAAAPGGTIKATRGRTVRVNWVNNLTTFDHPYMPVDPTLDWANPTSFVVPTGSFLLFPPGYPQAQTPVPAAPSLHGGEVSSVSAGSPNQWFTNNNITGPGLTPGTNYTAPNIANFVYPNGQKPTTLWYHDNAEGVSRLNQYSGLQGFYEISDPADTIEPLLPSGAFDIPLAIQDAMFNVDGTLAYPLGGLNPQIHPYWTGEFYGDVIMVNGKTWPNLNVDPREYRFRILNSSHTRFMVLNLNNGQPFVQIGSDGGYLPNPVITTLLTLAPGERADVLVDFSNHPAGTQIIMENTGLAPFPGLIPPGLPPNPDTNGQVMRFSVSGAAPVPPAGNLPFTLNTMPTLTTNTPTRTMTLHDAINVQTGASVGYYIDGQAMSAATDLLPAVGTTETWEIVNLGINTIPLRLPLVQARMVNRELYDSVAYNSAWYQANGIDPQLGLQAPLPAPTVRVPLGPYLLPPAEAPQTFELGWKDTIMIQPAEVTRIQVRFAPQDAVGVTPNVNQFPFDPSVGPGYFLQSSWPAAADNEMSRPLQVNAGAPVLNMTKTVANLTNPGGDAAPGDTLQYTITVTNNGAGIANNVVVTDPGPNDTSAPSVAGPYNLGNIAGGGASAQQVYTVTVNTPLAFTTQTISNTATATAGNHIPVTASASITAAQLPPMLGLAKSVSDANGDLIAQPGEVLTYTLTVTNNGPGIANNVVVTDPGPNNTSAPSPAGPYSLGNVAASGGTVQQVYTVTVDATVPGTVAAINNTAVVSANNHGPVDAMATIRNASSDLSPLSPLAIPKYVDQLIKPPSWTPTVVADGSSPSGFRHDYDISMERFQQQVLPIQFPATTVFGYSGTANLPGGPAPFRHSPSATFEAERDTPIRANYTNNLQNQFLPVDPTLHWADPLNLGMVMPPFEAWPPGYPEAQDIVPASVHLHGGEVQSDDDGGPDSWITGTDITGPGVVAGNHTGVNTLTSNYPNEQQATTLWYHDHALGATRINVLSGLAGFYLLRDPADSIDDNLPSGDYEVPIAIQDRSFNTDGTFSYPMGGVNPSIHPYWTPEFFGDTIMVNGKTWPNMNVEPRQYRFRLLNGSNARVYTLEMSNGMPFTQIGTDGGYLPHPVQLTNLTIAPAERADILVDFSGVPAGTQIIMTNWAPAPFPLGALPDPDTTGQIMRFTVQDVAPTPPASLPFNLATIPTLTPDSPNRVLTLNEAMNLTSGAPQAVLLNGQPYTGAVTETPAVGSTEMWEIVNLTADTHPIHLHLAQFQIVNRELVNALAYDFNWNIANGLDPSMGMQEPLDHPTVQIPVTPYLIPNPTPPMVNEQGWKDTIQVPPGMVTRIKVRWAPQDAVGTAPGVNSFPFDPTFGPGYVWHCHILEHEDNEMMRPLQITAGDTGKAYFWPWYDSINMMNWVLMGNPEGGANLDFDLSIGGAAQTLPDQFGAGAGIVPGAKTMFSSTPGVMDGPVIANSTTGDSAIVSQRTLMGDSLEEVLGTERSRLSDHFYWTWYDMFSPGFANWIMVGNPSTMETVTVDVTFNDTSSGSPVPVSDTKEIPPGEVRWITLPGTRGGPVELKARAAGGYWPADARQVVASQRVLSNNGTAFNEMPGIPASELSTNYIWTWYDMLTPGFQNWVLIANPDAVNAVNYEIRIAGVTVDSGSIPAGGMVTPDFLGEQGGPVEVIASANVIASQRIIAGPSFGEVAGYPVSVLSSNYHWTWYDMLTPGVSNWVLVANPSATETVHAVVQVTSLATGLPVTQEMDIPAGQNWTPQFPGEMGGPVEVTAYLAGNPAAPRNVIASQRVLWNGYFNEVMGQVLN